MLNQVEGQSSWLLAEQSPIGLHIYEELGTGASEPLAAERRIQDDSPASDVGLADVILITLIAGAALLGLVIP